MARHLSLVGSDGGGGASDWLQEVTAAVVGFHAEHYGRGAARARSYFADGVLACVMQEAFADFERALLSAQRRGMVRAMRLAFHEATASEVERIVEGISRRPVVSSGVRVSFRPEGVTATFVLDTEPELVA